MGSQRLRWMKTFVRVGRDVSTSLSPLSDQCRGASAGLEISFGQWQQIALARGFIRDRPILLLLDEPTAAIDAEPEHVLFERYAAMSRKSAPDEAPTNGRVTILVSHRLSTVRMADLIVVLDGARVVEVGAHEELVVKEGTYQSFTESKRLPTNGRVMAPFLAFEWHALCSYIGIAKELEQVRRAWSVGRMWLVPQSGRRTCYTDAEDKDQV
jgi:hypothetical protein